MQRVINRPNWLVSTHIGQEDECEDCGMSGGLCWCAQQTYDTTPVPTREQPMVLRRHMQRSTSPEDELKGACVDGGCLLVYIYCIPSK
jgi:hypothetical protein